MITDTITVRVTNANAMANLTVAEFSFYEFISIFIICSFSVLSIIEYFVTLYGSDIGRLWYYALGFYCIETKKDVCIKLLAIIFLLFRTTLFAFAIISLCQLHNVVYVVDYLYVRIITIIGFVFSILWIVYSIYRLIKWFAKLPN